MLLAFRHPIRKGIFMTGQERRGFFSKACENIEVYFVTLKKAIYGINIF
jgi:hypothetical protein